MATGGTLDQILDLLIPSFTPQKSAFVTDTWLCSREPISVLNLVRLLDRMCQDRSFLWLRGLKKLGQVSVYEDPPHIKGYMENIVVAETQEVGRYMQKFTSFLEKKIIYISLPGLQKDLQQDKPFYIISKRNILQHSRDKLFRK